MNKFKSAIEDYVANAPRIWDSVAYLRVESIDADYEQVAWTIAIRHRNTWQDAARILLNKSDLLRFVYDTTKRLKIHIDSPPARRLIFQGGALETTAVTYKRQFLDESNLVRNETGSGRLHRAPSAASAADDAFNLTPGA